ncbi:MAG TPA: hypothetical protein VHB77_22200, partial [Planctomycetaceae bacterium]|nr:hypothetical protein [Planctomycetaceae bacterium]
MNLIRRWNSTHVWMAVGLLLAGGCTTPVRPTGVSLDRGLERSTHSSEYARKLRESSQKVAAAQQSAEESTKSQKANIPAEFRADSALHESDLLLAGYESTAREGYDDEDRSLTQRLQLPKEVPGAGVPPLSLPE